MPEAIQSSGPKRVVIIGAGDRGTMFAGEIATEGRLAKVTAVVEPRPAYRARLATAHDLPAGHCFADWREWLASGVGADAAVIATPDRFHAEPAVACLDAGLDLLLEKPMGVSLQECRRIEAAQRRSGRIVGVCHSLRYQKGFRTVRDLLAGGAIGTVMSLDLVERVGIWHQAHSYVRGNWANEARSTFMLLAKSCHDLDYLSYLVPGPCLKVSSFGHLGYFTAANAPPGATARCLDGCPHEPTCTFSALRQYVHTDRTAWPANVCSADHSAEAHLEAIRTGPYGRCVWRCDNDAVDHQVVNLEFAGGVTAVFTMTAFTQYGGRRLRVYGTHGELAFDEGQVVIHDFAQRNRTVVELGAEHGSHGGGDARVMREWLTALHTRDGSGLVANAQESLRTHTIAFAAEDSRRRGCVVRLDEAPWSTPPAAGPGHAAGPRGPTG